MKLGEKKSFGKCKV